MIILFFLIIFFRVGAHIHISLRYRYLGHVLAHLDLIDLWIRGTMLIRGGGGGFERLMTRKVLHDEINEIEVVTLSLFWLHYPLLRGARRSEKN